MDIASTLKVLPDEPGVYIYRDTNGTVIYVGKARNLKNRVRSYFHSSNQNEKTRKLVSNIADIEYYVTANELEALLLENNLIKKYQPKYNILLKDDKGYPYLRLDIKQPYPRLELARKLNFDGALYFGPYHGASSAKAIAQIALSLFPLRTCNYDLSKNVKPCLKYHIKSCIAPCVIPDQDAYKSNVNAVIDFLKGNQLAALEPLREKMQAAAERLDFETAAQYRDKLNRASEILSKQKIVLTSDSNIDVIGVVLKETYAVICTMFVRNGRITGFDTVEQSDVEYETENELLTKFIVQKYTQPTIFPKEIVCCIQPDDIQNIMQIISDYSKKNVLISVPQRGKKRELALMARRNAVERMEKSALRLSYRDKRIDDGLVQLKEVLSLKEVPKRMECFDISHIQGTDTVASMVVFTLGKPDKKEYRRFKIQHPGNDDFASMEEVTRRRYTDGKNGKKGFEKLPDLIIIDGGKGQLHSAKEMLDGLNLNIPMIGLAKKLEEIFLPGSSDPVVLPHSAPALQILQSIRDEAHRFAITFHRSLRNKHTLVSALDNIPNIGVKRKKALIREFSTVSRIKQATIRQLEAVDGMNATAAKSVYDFFAKSGE